MAQAKNANRAVRCLAVALGLALTGCTVGYNGAWGLPSEQPQRQAAYEQAKQQQQQAAAQPRPAAQPAFQPANPHAVVQTSMPAAPADAPAAGDPLRPLTLFGDVPRRGPGLASALDGPDNLRRATFSPEGADFDPAVDPDGHWLVFASTRHREQSDIYLQRVDGTTVTQITNDPANDMMPCFSPDGKQIAFASDRAGNWDIYLVDANGGQPIQLTSDPAHDLHPSFSPDGTKLVYCTFGGQSGQWEMVVIDVANPAARRFIGYGLFPTWSPADSRILYQRASDRGQRRFSIWTVDLVDGEARRPTEIAASSNAAVITPNWSPDGQHVVFCTVVEPEVADPAHPVQADIWVIKADGTGRVNLTQSPFANLQPAWAADGTIYFVSNRGNNGTDNIWSVRPDRALKLAQGAGQMQSTARAARPAAAPTEAPQSAPAAMPTPSTAVREQAAAMPAPAPVIVPKLSVEVPTLSQQPVANGSRRAGSSPGDEAAAMVPIE